MRCTLGRDQAELGRVGLDRLAALQFERMDLASLAPIVHPDARCGRAPAPRRLHDQVFPGPRPAQRHVRNVWLVVRWGWVKGCPLLPQDLYPLPPLKSDASRYEEGSPNLIGIYGMRENLRILLDVGIDVIWERIRSLTSYLRDELHARGFEIWGPVDEERSSGIVSFRSPSRDTHAIFDRLAERKIKCSFREGHIRVSPHYYNTRAEIGELLDLL